MLVRTVLSVLLLLAMTPVAAAQRATLSVGDSAPGLDIEQWVKGELTSLEAGQVYLLVFFETNGATSRKAIPILTEYQDGYGDHGLTVVGIADEEVEDVKSFVTSQGRNLTFTVAADRRNSSKRAWFDAAGLSRMPAAFLIDRKGRIAYIGDPLEESFADVLGKVMQGRYDPVLNRQAAPILGLAEKNRKVRNWRMAFRYYDEVIELDKSVFAPVALERFEMMLVDMEDVDGAYKYARELLVTYADDAPMLADMARKVTLDPGIPDERRNLDLALAAAQASAKAAPPRDPDALAIQALVHFHAGNLEQAVSLQREAYFIAAPKRKPEFKRVLATYQEAAMRASRNP